MKQLHLNLYELPSLDIIRQVSVNLWKTLTIAESSHTRMTSTAAYVEPEEFRTIKRKPWLLGLTSQKKKQLGIISMLVIHIIVLLYFFIFIMVMVLVLELLKEDSGITVWEENRLPSMKVLLEVLLNRRYRDLALRKDRDLCIKP